METQDQRRELGLLRGRGGRFGAAAILSVTLSVAGVATQVAAHDSEGYRNDSTASEDNSDWMASLPAELPLSQLSLPGTHDTGAYNFGRETTETQGMDVSEQLTAGIRVWDMRLGNSHLNVGVDCMGDDLWTFHGISCQFEKFSDDILPAAQSFLQAHPGESILMRVKHENGDGTDFATRVEAEMDAFPGLFYDGGESNPTLGDVRGQIVLLRNYSGSSRGIDWTSLDIQDNYSMGDNWDLADKWDDVKAQLIAADDTSTMDTVYVNFLSAAGGGFPYFFASGHSSWETGAPRLATGWTDGVIDTCASADQCIDEYPRLNCFLGTCTVFFEGINNIAMEYIESSITHRTGIVMADFPGPGLIRAVIDLNPWNLPPTADAGGPYTAAENSPIGFDASGSTDPDGDALQYRWDFDGDGTFDTALSSTPTASHTFPDDFVGTATVEVSDGVVTSSATASVTVMNVDPVVTATAIDVNENGTTTLSGSITDPGPLDTFTLTVNWGEGTPESFTYPAGTTAYSVTHQYLDDNPTATAVDVYMIAVGIEDDDSGTGSASTTIQVSNLDPVTSLDSVADETGAEVAEGVRLALINTRVGLAASFTDVGLLDTHVASVDWGDGTIQDLGPKTGATGSSHVYAMPGDYTVTVTVTDDDLGSHSQTRDLVLVDAAGALEATAQALAELAADPALLGHEQVGEAVDWLVGQNGGRAANGALDLVLKGKGVPALDKFAKSLEALADAQAAGAGDLSEHESLITLAALSLATTAVDEAELVADRPNEVAKVALARDELDAGSAAMLAEQYPVAVDHLQQAVRAVSGVK